MAYAPSDGQPDSMLAAFKIVVAGGFGAGKTTLVGAVSEVQPLRTEESLSRAGLGLDDRSGVEDKTTTTVAMDFGRITINEHLVLYLFGTPGQERFWFMWDELSYGAIGAVILADTRRLSDCFPSVDYFEKCGLPFVIALNSFDGAPRYDTEDVRVALDLGPHVPVMYCDARQPGGVKQVLITLVENVLATSPAADPDPPPAPPAPHPPSHSPAPAAPFQASHSPASHSPASHSPASHSPASHSPASHSPASHSPTSHSSTSPAPYPADPPPADPQPGRAAEFFGAPTSPAAEERWPATAGRFKH